MITNYSCIKWTDLVTQSGILRCNFITTVLFMYPVWLGEVIATCGRISHNTPYLDFLNYTSNMALNVSFQKDKIPAGRFTLIQNSRISKKAYQSEQFLNVLMLHHLYPHRFAPYTINIISTDTKLCQLFISMAYLFAVFFFLWMLNTVKVYNSWQV